MWHAQIIPTDKTTVFDNVSLMRKKICCQRNVDGVNNIDLQRYSYTSCPQPVQFNLMCVY